MTRFIPGNLNELREAVATALTAEEPVEIVAGGSKHGLGRPLQTAHTLDLSRLSGIHDYAPSELVLTAGAATPIAEIERALAGADQMLAFEPPDWRDLLGTEETMPTLGGVLVRKYLRRSTCGVLAQQAVTAGHDRGRWSLDPQCHHPALQRRPEQRRRLSR